MTCIAQAVDFEHLAVRVKILLLGGLAQLPAEAGVVQLDDRLAFIADQELALMRFGGVEATDEGAERLEPVNEVVFEQKIERPVDRRRRRVGLLGLELIEQIVGLDRPVGFEHQLEHPPPRRRQTQPALTTTLLNLTNDSTGIHTGILSGLSGKTFTTQRRKAAKNAKKKPATTEDTE